jgi:hypothetical protein
MQRIRIAGASMIGIAAAAIALGCSGGGGSAGLDGGAVDAPPDQGPRADTAVDGGGDTTDGGDAIDVAMETSAGDAADAPSSDLGTDASRSDGAHSDGGGDDALPDVPPPACNLQAAFGPPVLVPGLPNQVAVYVSAVFSPDELTAYYSRSMGGVGSWDIYVAKRERTSDPFGADSLLTALSTTNNDTVSSVSSDGRALYLYSDRNRALGSYQIYLATRADLNADFGEPAPVAALNGSSLDSSAFITATGDHIYFASLRSANGDIYASPISGGVIGTPVKVPAINSANGDFSPVLSADQLTIFWDSNRPDGNAKGEFDIWTATRSSTSENFSAPRNVAELNTAGRESPTWLSPDGCRLYFEYSPANRDIGTLMMAERSR